MGNHKAVTRASADDQVPQTESAHFEPSVQLDLHSFLTELREWIDAVDSGNWETASERLRDACDEAYCLEGWKEFTNRLGTSNMQHHVHNLRRFLVAVETTARSVREKSNRETLSRETLRRAVLRRESPDRESSNRAASDDDTKRM